jgi:arylsulfatase A-like enzyme
MRSTTNFAPPLLTAALWWALLTALGEGVLEWRAHSWIWQDLMRAAIISYAALFLSAAALLALLNRSWQLTPSQATRVTLLSATLAGFDWILLGSGMRSSALALVLAIAAAALLAFLLHRRQAAFGRVLRWSLPLLVLAAAWCVAAFPVKSSRHEGRELARLPAPRPGSPNVLVVLIDTLRADHLPAYGYPRATAPRIARLAAEGVLFENAIAPSSWTLPAHASILTGWYPSRHHVDQLNSYFGFDYPVIGEAFKAHGYRTAAFSANELFFTRQRGFGRGFLHFEDSFQTAGMAFSQTFYGQRLANLLYPLRLKRNRLGRVRAAVINRNALRWIDRDPRPFFVFLNYFDVHNPYLPPERYLHRYTAMPQPGGRVSPAWEFARPPAAVVQGYRDAYDGAINYVDDCLADLLDELHRRGRLANTIVVVTSDHGEAFEEHGFLSHGNTLYREAIQVPLIFWAPGRIPSAARLKQPVSLTSLPSTLLQAAGAGSDPDFPQPSLAALWAGRPADTPEPLSQLARLDWSPLFPNYYGAMQSIATAEWHYIDGGKGGPQLFSWTEDPSERRNLAQTEQGKKAAALLARKLNAPAPPAQHAAGQLGVAGTAPLKRAFVTSR